MDTAPAMPSNGGEKHIQIIDASGSPESEDIEELQEERVMQPPQPMDFPERNGEPIEPFTVKRSFENLDGRCLDLIAAYTGGRLPEFVCTNKKVFDTFLTYQIQINDEVSKAIISEMSPPPKLKQAGVFSLRDELYEEFQANMESDYDQLLDLLSSYKLKPKDIVVLKLFLSFMKLNYSDKHEKLFMRQTQ